MEILVVDDCGTDGSMAVVTQIKEKHARGEQLKVIRQPENMGISEARNVVIDNARGDFIYFIDSDDFLEPNAIEIMAKEVSDLSTDAVLASSKTIDLNLNTECSGFSYPDYKVVEGKDEFAKIVCKDLHFNMSVCSWNILFNVRFLRDNHLHFLGRNSEDILFLTRYYPEVKKAVLMPNVTYNYILRKNSLMGYYKRDVIPVWEIRERFMVDEAMTKESKRLCLRSFYDVHCTKVIKHKFRAVCIALRHSKKFSEKLTNREIAQELRHPASFSEIIRFKRYRFINLMFFFLGHTPNIVCVKLSFLIGKKLGWV